MTLIPGLLALVAGYLLGSIPSGYLAGRWLMGLDILAVQHLGLDRGNLVLGDLHRTLAAHEPNHPLDVLDEIPRLLQRAETVVQEEHLDVNVPRVELAVGDRLLAATNLHNLLHRDENLIDVRLHLVGPKTTLDAVPDFLLLSGKAMQGVPAVLHGFGFSV